MCVSVFRAWANRVPRTRLCRSLSFAKRFNFLWVCVCVMPGSGCCCCCGAVVCEPDDDGKLSSPKKTLRNNARTKSTSSSLAVICDFQLAHRIMCVILAIHPCVHVFTHTHVPTRLHLNISRRRKFRDCMCYFLLLVPMRVDVKLCSINS